MSVKHADQRDMKICLDSREECKIDHDIKNKNIVLYQEISKNPLINDTAWRNQNISVEVRSIKKLHSVS